MAKTDKSTKSKKLPARCRFYASCRKSPVTWATHSHLGQVAVCDSCKKNNPYLAKD